MELTLKRIAKRDTYTIGKLYVDGKYVCDTLEPKDRGLNYRMPLAEIKRKKVYGQTAIPTGRYEVLMNICSPKYSQKQKWKEYNGGFMPRLKNVPAYSGVLFHPGNTEKDTDGCPLVGENKLVGKVINSEATFKRLYPIMLDAHNRGEKITVEVI